MKTLMCLLLAVLLAPAFETMDKGDVDAFMPDGCEQLFGSPQGESLVLGRVGDRP